MSGQSQLRIYNSLTRTKDIFRPLNGNQVKLYICGPTVYDLSHMGHARAYLSFDIFRRVLSSYFNYDLLYIMNITDIDDKIIKRARQEHLYQQYLQDNKPKVSRVFEDIQRALKLYETRHDAEVDADKKKMMSTMLAEVNSTVRQAETAFAKDGWSTNGDVQCESLIKSAKSVLYEWLDHEKGSSVVDMDVFAKLARKFENEFFNDMKQLNVQEPDVLTRVSDYIPEILSFVEGIINQGYAYKTSDGSVYFDTEKFAQSSNHTYAKLVPEAYGCDKENAQKHMRESEGELSVGKNKVEKKSPTDFALWKASKSGEPSWKSQFGDGRPGWHIECSAMSSALCGPKLDIHAGGSDLKFPHHDNEIAQCEAYFDSDHWVNYFLHCGTLRIEGLKMSKSLKNFITIKDALTTYTSRQIRLLFLMHNFCDCLDYSTQTMERALQFERFSNEFFLNVKDLLRRNKSDCLINFYQKYNQPELSLLNSLFTVKAEIHAALCDSIDTRTVIEKMRELINTSNIYIAEKATAKLMPNAQLLKSIADYLTYILKVFGVIPDQEQLGYPVDDGQKCSVDRESILMPYLDGLAVFRASIKTLAKEHNQVNILQECDRLRDEVLPKLGVRLEDCGTHTGVKIIDPEVFLREQQQKQAIEKAKQVAKKQKQQEKEEKERQKQLIRQIPLENLFKQGQYKNQFSEYDDDGIPTHNSEGKELSKNQRKKVEKAWQEHKRILSS